MFVKSGEVYTVQNHNSQIFTERLYSLALVGPQFGKTPQKKLLKEKRNKNQKEEQWRNLSPRMDRRATDVRYGEREPDALDREVKSLFYADDLVLLSPTEQGLQQQLDIVEKCSQSWALAFNINKTNVVIFKNAPDVRRTNTSVQ